MTAEQYNAREIAAGRLKDVHINHLVVEAGGDLVLAVRQFQQDHGLRPDGMAGPRTRAMIETIHGLWVPTVDPIPVGRKEMMEVYGDPEPWNDQGVVHINPNWERKHMIVVSASLIYGYHRPIYMHKKVKAHFLEAMRRSVLACPGYAFVNIGCFNPRFQRNDPSRPISDHTLGIAFDLNGRDGQNKWAPDDIEPWSDGWSRYSNLPREVVESFESVGFDWGGWWKGGRDTMHMSLRKIR